MPLRRSKPLTFRPHGVSDTLDASNSSAGSMGALTNLVPAPSTKSGFAPRPAANKTLDFVAGGFNTPGNTTAMLVIGSKVYGLISTARNANHDEPFAYDLIGGTFAVVANVTNGNTPVTQPTSGDWTPPTMAMVGSRIYVTHPGFTGVGQSFFGFFDISGFSSTSITGSTHGTTTLDTLSSNVLQAGWQVGMTISDAAADIPAGTTIVAIASNGLSVTLSQAATGSHAGTACTVAGGTVGAPLWGNANTNGNALTAVPVAVSAFNGRAYWAVANNLQFSDSLNGSQITNASQALSLGDNVAITAVGGVPLQNPLQGGSVQSLIAFKGQHQMFQVTGDPATNNLAVNQLNVSTGTLSPKALVGTPDGLGFFSPEGLRFVDESGQITEPVGAYGDGVAVPFQNALNPSRMVAAFNNDTVRVSLQDGSKASQPFVEYWFNLTTKQWTGPHTFSAYIIDAVGLVNLEGWLFGPQGVTGSLWNGPPFPTLSSGFTENGNALSWTYDTSLLPDNEELAMNALQEAAIGLQLGSNQLVTVQAIDETGTILDTITLSTPVMAGTKWGSFTWGSALWAGGVPGLFRQYGLNWHTPLIFKQMHLRVSGFSQIGMMVENVYLRYQILGYALEGDY